MEAAAKNLTPVTLELGGKSPCIVDSDVDIDLAAGRIVSGKFLNAGQTCIAPDYLLVHEETKDNMVDALREKLFSFFGKDPQRSPDYGRIINTNHFDRLTGYLQSGDIIAGGNTDKSELYIAPTLIENVSWKDPIMQDEIFGPVLPVFAYDNLSQVVEWVNSKPKPLSLYFFSRNRSRWKKILNEISFGGGCINDTILHVANPNLPFGGVGNSGMGRYHGRYSFETFSHQKSIVKTPFWFDIPLRLPPFEGKLDLLKKIFRIPF